jgi:regulatory protein
VELQRKRRSKPSGPELTPRSRALRLLARREHTRAELERKLAPYLENETELTALLDDLTARGWMSESRVAEQLVHAKRGRYGASRIRQILIQRGVSADVIAPALASLKEGEMEAARAVWSRKFRAPPRDNAERARHVRFLQARGFSIKVAMRVARFDDDSGSR